LSAGILVARGVRPPQPLSRPTAKIEISLLIEDQARTAAVNFLRQREACNRRRRRKPTRSIERLDGASGSWQLVQGPMVATALPICIRGNHLEVFLIVRENGLCRGRTKIVDRSREVEGSAPYWFGKASKGDGCQLADASGAARQRLPLIRRCVDERGDQHDPVITTRRDMINVRGPKWPALATLEDRR